MQSFYYCLSSPTRDNNMSCKATLDKDDQTPHCDFASTSNHHTIRCPYPATNQLSLKDGGDGHHYCDFHYGYMAFTWRFYNDHLKKWEGGEAHE